MSAANNQQMADVNDMDLMREYADRNSESAFSGLVHRHINLVYSVALRYTGNSQDAQDVTQAVFVILAKKSAGLRQRTTLIGWLYETTRFTARQLLRTRVRQQARDQEAYMQSTLNDSDTDNVWLQLAPLLEEAMTRLNEKERTLLALRFFENKSGSETAALLGIQEYAAHKGASRALEKLRKFFMRHGVSSTTAIITVAISANSVQAAPVALAKSVTVVAIAKGAAASGSTLTLIKGALKIMAWTKMKTVMVVGMAVILVARTTVVVTQHKSRDIHLTDFGAIDFTDAHIKQVLEIYQKLSGLDLTLAPEVNRLNAGITLKADHVTKAEMTKLFEQALLEQAGIVITKNGRAATVTYNGTAVAHPVPPMSPSPRVPPPPK